MSSSLIYIVEINNYNMKESLFYKWKHCIVMIHCYNKQTCTQLRNTEQELLKTLIILYIFRSLEMKRLLGQRLYQKMLDKLVSWLKGMFNWKCLNCLEILIRYLLSVTIEPVVKIFKYFNSRQVWSLIGVFLVF